MKDVKVIYYNDELNDEFSKAKIKAKKIDGKYKYIKSPLWNFMSFIFQNILSMPLKILYPKIKFRIDYMGIEKLSPYNKNGYLV